MGAVDFSVIGSMLTQKEIVNVVGGFICWCVKNPYNDNSIGDVLLRGTRETSLTSIASILSARSHADSNLAWSKVVDNVDECQKACCGRASWWIAENGKNDDCPACGCGIL